ncbi:MAG: leucine-rich repeat domain-containing protein [Lachnospiraceae bacterium]|nr:leucine-rich repeat domain-containing protein [Lachnospiraceae bacterium]
MSDKAYKKIYVNGDCVIDFTKQTINENNIASGNLFFNEKGELIEGKDDSNELIKGMLYLYDSDNICYKDGLRLGCITKYGIVNSLSSITYSSNFPFLQYMKYGAIETISTDSYDYNCYYDYQHSIYLPKIAVAADQKSSFYNKLITFTYSSNFYGQVFCQDDLSQFELPEYNTDLIISNCSEIKTTENGTFDYVIADNKVYIISLNHEKSYLDRDFIYEDTYSYQDSGSEYTNTVSGVSIKFPDEIEDLPVVSLGAGIFGQAMSYYYGYDYDSKYVVSSILRINFPKDLEILNANSFSSFNRICGPAIKFPNKLRTINDNASDYYYATFYGDSSMFSEETLPLPDSLINIPGVTLKTICNALSYQGISLDYIPTESNNIAYYIKSSNTEITDLVISEGCLGVVQTPSNITSIQLPSTITSLPPGSLSRKTSLTSITFAETVTATEISASFCAYSSNSAFTDIVIPEGIETINESAFEYCTALQNITLPSTIKFIDYNAFYEGYNTSLTKVIKIKAQTPPRLYSTRSIVYSTNNLLKIIVPQGCLDKYKTASNWSSFASKMEESTEW